MSVPEIRPGPNGQRIAELHERARATETICLQSGWLGAKYRYQFRCQHGHEWDRTASTHRANAACPQCGYIRGAAKQRKSENLQRLQDIAQQRGGACLSTEYINARAKYEFKCAADHTWWTHGYAVLGGSWCRQCVFKAMLGKPKSAQVRAKLSIVQRLPDGLQRLQQKALEAGGRLLSTSYAGTKGLYFLKCAAGHEWKATGESILAGLWCRHCGYAKRRFSIEVAQQAAKARGGQCLSQTYQNNQTPLTWECDQGHVWEAPLSTVRNKGCWCAECYFMAKITRADSPARARYRNHPLLQPHACPDYEL
jgi:ribosomal protein L32